MRINRVSIISWLTFSFSLASYFLIYEKYFPIYGQYLGNDYSLFLPQLVDNYTWFAKNGLFSPPWFSPTFCGGQVNFADPQSIYYSIPQFLLFAGVDPVTAVFSAMLLLASIGFWGMYLLTNKCFKLSNNTALLCAALFMYNDFFAYRMIIGHITFHGFMLLPLTSYLLLSVTTSTKTKIINSICAGVIIAYWYLSGMAIIMLPCLIAILATGLLLSTYNKNQHINDFYGCFLLSIIISITLSSSKLVGSLNLMEKFSRHDYLLPGFSNFFDIFKVFFYSLFFTGNKSSEIATPLWLNQPFPIAAHEMAFGVTIIPLIIFIVSTLAYIKILLSKPFLPTFKNINLVRIAPLLLLLTLPIALVFYSPQWNLILKSIPIVSETVSPQRWMLIYLLPIIILVGISLDRFFNKYNAVYLILTLFLLPIIVSTDNKANGMTIINLMKTEEITSLFQERKVHINDFKIKSNAGTDNFILAGRNYFTLKGFDVLNCYNPTYGYFLDKISLQGIEIGNPLKEVSSGKLNIRNPACILYPEENHCALWDNFTLAQKNMADSFINYRPFPFKKSRLQHIADLTTQLSWLSVTILLLSQIIAWLLHRLKKQKIYL